MWPLLDKDHFVRTRGYWCAGAFFGLSTRLELP